MFHCEKRCCTSAKKDLHFGDIALLELSALVNKGRVVTHDVVDRDAGWEGNTTLEVLALFAGKGLLDLVLNHRIDRAANGGDVSAWHGKLDGLGEALCKTKEISGLALAAQRRRRAS